MVYGHSETVVIGVTWGACACSPSFHCDGAGQQHARCRDLPGHGSSALTERAALLALSRYSSAALTVDIWTYFGGCVAAIPKPVPTGLCVCDLEVFLRARLRAALSVQ